MHPSEATPAHRAPLHI